MNLALLFMRPRVEQFHSSPRDDLHENMTSERQQAQIKRLKSVDVTLDDATVAMAHQLGEGNLSLGLRRAVAIAALRNSKCECAIRRSCDSSALNEYLGLCAACPF
jgi:hypothetical protein